MSRTHRKSSPPVAAGRQPNSRATKATTATAGSRRLDLAIGIALVLAVFVVYAQVGHFPFITFDDPYYVNENRHVIGGLTPESVKWAITTVVDSNWVPVTMLSHMAVCEFFGLASGMHHWANVLLHALAAVLLFAWLKRATGALWPAAFVAFVFALHPLHVESVAWVSERKDVLSACFWFLALYVYTLYAERPSRRRYALVIVLFALGMMAKPMLVTFPFTLLLLDVWPLRRPRFRRTLWEKAPFFAISIAISVLVYLAQTSTGAVQTLPLGDRLWNTFVSYAAYIRQMFWPTGLAIYYPFPKSFPIWQAGAALAMIAGISVLAVLAWRTRPYIATGWFWYLGTLVPVIGLVQAGLQAHADRYMYVPMVGLTVILAWGAADLVKKWPKAGVMIGSAAVISCLACLVAAHAQTEYWRSSESLYQRDISATEDNWVAEFDLANYLSGLPGRASEACPHFQAAARMKPDLARAHNGLGVCLLRAGRSAEAAGEFEVALHADPAFAEAHYNLGLAYSKSPDRVLDAIAQYEAALRIAPNYASAHKNLGLLLLRIGRTPEAISHFEAVQRVRSDPEIVKALKMLRAQ